MSQKKMGRTSPGTPPLTPDEHSTLESVQVSRQLAERTPVDQLMQSPDDWLNGHGMMQRALARVGLGQNPGDTPWEPQASSELESLGDYDIERGERVPRPRRIVQPTTEPDKPSTRELALAAARARNDWLDTLTPEEREAEELRTLVA